MDHQKTDDRAEEDVAAEDSRRGDCDDDGQVSECGICNDIEELEPVRIAEAQARDLCKGLDQTHHQTGCDDGRKDRDENVADGLQHLLPDRLLRSSRCLDVILGASRDAGHRDELIKNLIDSAGTDDQLELSVGLEHTLDAVHFFQCRLVDFAVIRNNETKSGGAVRSAYDVFSAADIRSDLFRAFSVIQCHKKFPLKLFGTACETIG